MLAEFFSPLTAAGTPWSRAWRWKPLRCIALLELGCTRVDPWTVGGAVPQLQVFRWAAVSRCILSAPRSVLWLMMGPVENYLIFAHTDGVYSQFF
uniref:Secreted protein n=1 Tax=Knipowitschia caucasica TaxID=637954 RepID=A0AAV2KJX0_KNICA